MKLRSTLAMYTIVPILFLVMSCTKTEESIELAFSKSHSNNQLNACIDIDGNVYKTIKIGNQVWMAENLRVTRYQNGQAINFINSASVWANLASQNDKAAVTSYNNNQSNVTPYGLLYTWYAANDPRGLAPKGWHIPTDAEWIELGNTLGGYLNAGGKMKTTGTLEAGTGLWMAPNTGATNSSGFSAVPSGERSASGVFDGLGARTHWWTSKTFEGDEFNMYSLNTNIFSNQNTLYNSSGDNFTAYNALAGLSVRCVKDK